MIVGWAVLVYALAYVGFLFAIAWYGDRVASCRGQPAALRPVIYALSLAVYCTSWTFYGSVGLAASTGYDFLPNYIGPILLFTLGWPLLHKIVRIWRNCWANCSTSPNWMPEPRSRRKATSASTSCSRRYWSSSRRLPNSAD